MAKLSKRTKQTIILCSVLVIAAAIAVAAIVIVSYKKKKELEDRGKLFYKTLAEVLAEAPNALDKTYDNMTLPESVSLTSPEKLYTLNLDLTQNYITEDQLKQKCIDTAKYLNGKEIDAEQLELETYNRGSFEYSYYTSESSDETDDYCVRLGSSGDCLIWNANIIQNEVGEAVFAPPVTETYAADDPTLESFSCDLAGENYTAKKALTYAQKTVDDILPRCTEYESVRPVLLCVLDNANNEHQSFLVRFAFCTDGVEFDTTGTTEYGGLYMQYNYVEVIITRPDIVTQIHCENCNRGIQKNELEDKFVTLDSAIDHASVEFAKYFENAVTDIDIVYAAPSAVSDSEEYLHLEYRPMWRLSLEEPNNLKIRCIYIDMVTGALIYDPCDGTLITDKDKT